VLIQIKNHFIQTSIILALSVLSLVISISSVYATTSISDTTKQQHSLLSVVSVRNNTSLDLNELTKLVDDTITKFNINQTCSNEIAIYIHGFNKDKNDAGEEFNRLQTSLKNNNYIIPLVGFSWDSKVSWEQAKVNAKNSGEELAKFIYKFKNQCSNTDIHIIAHSLGASVVDSALSNLVKYLDLKNNDNNSKIIKDVHLLGAAINNELIMNKTPFGNAINDKVETFFNLYNPEDDGLEINRFVEKHNPLGSVGAPNQNKSQNYFDINVTNEIPILSDADGDGNLEECFEEYGLALKEGDNHCGYIGFREPFSNALIDDGAIDVVVRDWRNP
jgi:esterase/lipase superfamily enzyme